MLAVYVLAGYVVVGFVFALAFVTMGVGRVDPVAQHAPAGFRAIIVPGVTALWPLLLIRWVKGVRS